MNCWRFDAAIFEACAAIGPSPRGELELPDAVQYAIDVLRQPFRAIPVRGAGARLDQPSRRGLDRSASCTRGGEPVIPRLDDPPEVSDRENLAERLQQAGLSPSAARRRAELFCAAAMLAAHDSSALPRAAAFYVPGRIEVLGKHTDYAGGRSLVLAADQGFSLVAAPRDDRLVVVLDAVRRAACAFELAPGLAPQTGPWSNYPATVARRVARNFPGAARAQPWPSPAICLLPPA